MNCTCEGMDDFWNVRRHTYQLGDSTIQPFDDFDYVMLLHLKEIISVLVAQVQCWFNNEPRWRCHLRYHAFQCLAQRHVILALKGTPDAYLWSLRKPYPCPAFSKTSTVAYRCAGTTHAHLTEFRSVSSRYLNWEFLYKKILVVDNIYSHIFNNNKLSLVFQSLLDISSCPKIFSVFPDFPGFLRNFKLS